MKVILTEKVKSLGTVGEIVTVSAGYGRNYLLPKQFAVIADESSKAQAAHNERRLATKIAAEKSAASELQGKVNGITLDLIKRVGTNGRLFGTVTTVELAKELALKDLDVERRNITLSTPIRTIGSYDATVKLFAGVEATFKINVLIDPKQAEELKIKEKEKAEAKAKKEAEALLAKEAGEEEGSEEKKELTDEERLKIEADNLLRS